MNELPGAWPLISPFGLLVGVWQGAASGKVGLLVSERMINCPIQAVPKLYEALVEDIAWAVENEVLLDTYNVLQLHLVSRYPIAGIKTNCEIILEGPSSDRRITFLRA